MKLYGLMSSYLTRYAYFDFSDTLYSGTTHYQIAAIIDWEMAGLYPFYEYVYKDRRISRKHRPISNSSNIYIGETTVCPLSTKYCSH